MEFADRLRPYAMSRVVLLINRSIVDNNCTANSDWPDELCIKGMAVGYT